jgi:type IV pilus assembly protein PilE
MNCKTKSRGFTLLELMIVVAIIAILAAVAVPSYSRYVTKSRASSAAGDIYALSLAMENMFQRQLIYPATPNITDAAITSYTRDIWSPTEGDLFQYSLSVDSTNQSYLITATGRVGTNLSGCSMSLSTAVDSGTGMVNREVSVTDSSLCGGYGS